MEDVLHAIANQGLALVGAGFLAAIVLVALMMRRSLLSLRAGVERRDATQA